VSWNFPSARELSSSILGVWTINGGGAFLSRLGCRRGRSPVGCRCNFLHFLGFSVSSQYQWIVFFLAKKKNSLVAFLSPVTPCYLLTFCP
jgi:hypothetical protein